MRATTEKGTVTVPGRHVHLELTEKEYQELEESLKKLSSTSGESLYRLYQALFGGD